MKNKCIKAILAGAVSAGILLSSNAVYAKDMNNSYVDINKNIVLLAKQDGLQDGKYNVGIQALKEKSEELSMAGQYVNSNAILDVHGKDMYVTIKVSRSDWMKNIRIWVNGSPVKYQQQVKDKEGQISTLKFKIPNRKSEIKFKMNIVQMGNAEVAFRIVLNDNVSKISSAVNNTTFKASQQSKVNNKSKENKLSKDKNDKKNTDSKELPQTGSPISGSNLAIIGGVSTLLGAVLIKKRK